MGVTKVLEADTVQADNGLAVHNGGADISGSITGDSTWVNTGDIHGRKLFADNHDSQTGSANGRSNTTEQLVNATSHSKYKLEQEPLSLEDVRGVLGLTPITWFDRSEVEENDGSTEGLHRIPGVTAEDVEEHIPALADYDARGDLRGVSYDRMAVLLIPIIQDCDTRLAGLEAEVERLRSLVDTYINLGGTP